MANLIDDGQGVELYNDIVTSETFRLAINLQIVAVRPAFEAASSSQPLVIC